MKSWRNIVFLFLFWSLTAGLAFWQGGFAGSFLFYSIGVVFLYILLVQFFSLVRVEVNREEVIRHLDAGDEVHINVRIRQRSWVPLAWLVLQEEWSHSGNSSSVKTAKLRHQAMFFPWWKRTFEYRYTLRGLHRGIYTLSRSTVTGGDIFGWIAKKVNVDRGAMRITVFPKPLMVKQGMAGTGGQEGEVILSKRYWPNSVQVRGIRDYLQGDPMNHIHWKAVARTQTLRTKEMEPSTSIRTMIFLDATASNYSRGAGNELFECAVQAAAGLIQHSWLRKMQWGITVTDHANHALPISNVRGTEQGYELLAGIQPDGEGLFHQIVKQSIFRLPPDVSLFLITASLTEPLVSNIAELRRRNLDVALIYVQDAPVLAWKARQMRDRLEAVGCTFSWINANYQGGMAYAGTS